MQKILRCTLFIFLNFIGLNFIFAQIPKGNSLLPNGEPSLKPYGFKDNEDVIKVIDVEGQPFNQALEINTFNLPAGFGDVGLNAAVKVNLYKGDVLWISFKVRSLQSKRETGESFVELRLDHLKDGKYVWPSHLERGISFGSKWTEISVPFVMENDAKPEDLRLVVKFDSYPEKFQMSQLKFVNYGQEVKLSDLPRSVIRYQGDEPEASWRKAADENIEKYRKGNLAIKVLDENGKPVNGAKVEIKLKRIAFNWGTATNSKILLNQKDNNAKIYRDTLLTYFNQVVFENELKAKQWATFDHQQTLKAIEWLDQNHIQTRGHVMVWPSWQHSPSLKLLKEDTAALRKAVFKLIDEQTAMFGDKFTEWDVVNEPYLHHDLTNLLGSYEMAEWFKRADKNAPGVKLFLNDYTMFHAENNNFASEKFYQNVKYLLDNHAPIDAIGEQGHIGGTPPGIPYVIERLNHFATLGLPIQISEFDINSNDDEFKARYTGDFMKAVFSNPATTGFVQWGFWEAQHWFPVAALWDKNWNIRANGKVFTDLVSKTWNTNETDYTKDSGTVDIRGFNGEYEIAVSFKGKLLKQQTTLDSNGKSVIIKLQ